MIKTIQIIINALLILFVQNIVNGQQDPLIFDYSKVDNYVLNLKVKKPTDIPQLAIQLTKPFNTDVEKARAIFRWVAATIAYDIKGFHSSSNKGYSFTYSSEEELKRLMKEKELELAKETIRKKAGVCQGYAQLFKTLCDEVGIETQIVSGHARIDPRRIGQVSNQAPNHAWNAVKLNGQWYLLDATWASGYTDPAVTKFTREYNDRYFLTPPELFVLDHYPEDQNWQLLDNKVSKKDFFSFPHIQRGFHSKEITSFSPKKGEINVKKGESVKFSFTANKNVSGVTVAKQTDKFSDSAQLQKNGNQYSFNYYFQKKGSHILNIFIDHQWTIVYKVNVK